MAIFYSKGTISHMSEVTSGRSQSGRDWARMTIMIDIPGYQGSISKISFQVGTDRIDDVCAFKVGDRVEIGWTIYAREYNGKWYNNVDLVNIKSQDQQPSQTAPAARSTRPAPAAPQNNRGQASDLDPQNGDLPF